MTTLADIALTCAKQLGRASADGLSIVDLQSEIKAEIGNAIREYNRRPWHLTEVRNLKFTTVSGTIWYDTMTDTDIAGDQSASSGGTRSASDIIAISYMRENQSSLTDGLRRLHYGYFERLQEGSALGGIPTGYTYYAGQVGIYPVPLGGYEITLSATLKPQVPTADADESVWFTQAPELIEAAACVRVALKHLRDEQMAARYQPILEATERNLHGEYVRKSRTGRLVAHD